MTKKINSVKLDGDNNVVIQSVHGSTVNVTTLAWDDFVQKYTHEQTARIAELQEQLRLHQKNEQLIDEKLLRISGKLNKAQEEKQQIETQLQKMISEYQDKDLSLVSELYREAFEVFMQGDIKAALEILTDAKLDEELLKAKEAMKQNAESRILKAEMLRLEFRFEEAGRNYEKAVEIYPSSWTCVEAGSYFGFLNLTPLAEKYFRQSLEYSNTKYEKTITLHNLGFLQFSRNELKDAEEYYNKSLIICRKLVNDNSNMYLSQLALVLNSLGILKRKKNELEDAQENYNEALMIYRRLSRENSSIYLTDLAMILHNIGNLQHNKNKLESSLKGYTEALDIYRKLESSSPKTYLPNIANTLNNLGLLQNDRNEFEDALNNYTKALDIYQRLAKNNPKTYLPNVGIVLHNLGLLQHGKNALEDAQKKYNEALFIRRKLAKNNPQMYLPHLAMTLNNLSIFYLESKPNREKSIQFATEIIQIAKQFKQVPALQHDAQQAVLILKDWGVNTENLLKQ